MFKREDYDNLFKNGPFEFKIIEKRDEMIESKISQELVKTYEKEVDGIEKRKYFKYGVFILIILFFFIFINFQKK